jgi:hypothetical protein
VADWLNAYVVAQHPEKEALREKWMMAKDRWAARAGWNLTASRVDKGADGLDLPALLDRIEKEMPKGMPEVQWTMNNTLAAIGIHDSKLRKRAIAIGEKIGLYRDWPVAKGCTPLCSGAGGGHGEAAGLRKAARHVNESFGTPEQVKLHVQARSILNRNRVTGKL